MHASIWPRLRTPWDDECTRNVHNARVKLPHILQSGGENPPRREREREREHSSSRDRHCSKKVVFICWKKMTKDEKGFCGSVGTRRPNTKIECIYYWAGDISLFRGIAQQKSWLSGPQIRLSAHPVCLRGSRVFARREAAVVRRWYQWSAPRANIYLLQQRVGVCSCQLYRYIYSIILGYSQENGVRIKEKDILWQTFFMFLYCVCIINSFLFQ